MSDWEKSTEDGVPGKPPQGKPYLSVLGGRHAGRLYPLEPGKICRLGKSSECNPRFPKPGAISSIHAEVTVEMGRVILRDVSKNGTTVADRVVHRTSTVVANGEPIVLSDGESTLRLEWLCGDEVELRLQLFMDDLTGCWKTRHLESRLADLLDSPEDSREPLSVVMLDIDHFGIFNKTHGQGVGNDVLRGVTSCLRSTVSDLHPAADVGRIGGEEFLILAPRCDAERGRSLAETARARIEALTLAHDGHALSVTASFGGATRQPAPGQSLNDLRALANAPLILAKNSGRNRVVWEGDPVG